MRRSDLVLELCVDDVDGARAAEAAGIDRIELCSALSEAGLTVSIGLAGATLDALERTGVQVLIRPRPGHFVYDRSELAIMERDIAAIMALEHAPAVRVGFVLGALTAAMRVDVDAISRLRAACGEAPMTFHRAFDLLDDPLHALEELHACGVDRILTAGGPGSALEGSQVLAALVAAAGDQITIVAAGGVRPENITRIARATGARELHFALRSTIEVPALARAGTTTLLGAPVALHSVAHTDTAMLAAIIAATDAPALEGAS